MSKQLSIFDYLPSKPLSSLIPEKPPSPAKTPSARAARLASESEGARAPRKMIITAKFASMCPQCRTRIAVGSKVNWTKGHPAEHVECFSGPRAVVASSSGRSPRESPERRQARRHGWDGIEGSSSYYTSGLYDEES